MDYLYFLQQLRDGTPKLINDAVLFISEFVAGVWGLALLALIYWCISKRAGIMLLMSFSLSQVVNNIVKNILCVERPFLKDDRLTPYVPVKGYSFPSGHTMMAASFYGGVAVWQRKRKWLVGICIFMMLFTAFTRNWLGAHTLQDVAVGILLSCGLVALNCFILREVDKHPERDLWVLAGALLLCIVFCILNPNGMRPAGMYGGVMIGWFIERRFINFKNEGTLLFRAAAFALGFGVIGLLYKLLLPAVFAPMGSSVGGMFIDLITFSVLTAGWPAVIKFAQGFINKKSAA